MRVTKTFAFDSERDADLLDWLEGQPNQTAALRVAIRTYILNNGTGQEKSIQDALEAALSGLRDVVASAMREVLSTYRIPVVVEYGEEDPELAARLDAQLEEFFGE